MPRRKSILDDIFDLLKITPFWVGPTLAVVVFVLFRFMAPALVPPKQGNVDVGGFMRPVLAMLSWFIGGAVLMAWVMAEIWKLMNHHLLDSQTGIASIKTISWQEFERLVSEAYRRKGYVADVVGSISGDGGVDIRLYGHGEKVLVQCKQWKAYKVGVNIMRELLGVVVSEKANRGIVVTSGKFTQEAKTFARQNPQIELVDGPELVELIRGVQAEPSISLPQKPLPVSTPQAASSAPICPQCGSQMVLKTARKGRNPGSQFWGCQNYPACRGIKQI